MGQIAQLKNCKLSSRTGDALEIQDVAGELESKIYLSAFGRIYRLGCLDVDARIIFLKRSLTLIDNPQSTAFHILSNGEVFSIGIEDWQFQHFAEDTLFYSDSGLILLNDQGSRAISFMSLNEYHIDIQFSRIIERIVEFEFGDSRISFRSIEDLDELVGRDIKSENPRVVSVDDSAFTYSLTGEI